MFWPFYRGALEPRGCSRAAVEPQRLAGLGALARRHTSRSAGLLVRHRKLQKLKHSSRAANSSKSHYVTSAPLHNNVALCWREPMTGNMGRQRQRWRQRLRLAELARRQIDINQHTRNAIKREQSARWRIVLEPHYSSISARRSAPSSPSCATVASS